jgi:hypothetical protein
MSPTAAERYDVVLSYAREDGTAVRELIYERLVRCSTRDGRRPRVFIDVRAMEAGEDVIEALDTAIEECVAFVPVLSRSYFESPICREELNTARWTRLQNGTPKLIPLQYDRAGAAMVRGGLRRLQHIRMEGAWFAELCRALDLVEERPAPRLTFRSQPTDTVVNHTLPPIVVAADGDEPAEITLGVERGVLHGTTRQLTVAGLARFEDLSVTAAVPETRLAASRTGDAGEVLSEPFAVTEPRPAPPRRTFTRAGGGAQGPVLQACFLAEDHLAVLRSERLEIVDRDGTVLDGARLDGPVRILRRRAEVVAVAGWAGWLVAGGEDGLASWDLSGDRGGFVVPGDLALSSEHVDAGLWDGTIQHISLSDPTRPPRPLLEEAAGVQALAAAAGRLYVADLDGRLRAYDEQGRLVAERQLEPVVHLLKAYDQALVAVGGHTLYRLPFDLEEAAMEPLPLRDVTAAFGETPVPVIVDADGRGIRLDEQLTIVGQGFRTTPGARPRSADDTGRWCVVADPTGSQALVHNGRVVYTQRGGVLAVSPSGDRVAVADGGAIGVLPTSELAGQ